MGRESHLDQRDCQTPIIINLTRCVDRLVSKVCFQKDWRDYFFTTKTLVQLNHVFTEHLVLFLESFPRRAIRLQRPLLESEV